MELRSDLGLNLDSRSDLGLSLDSRSADKELKTATPQIKLVLPPLQKVVKLIP